MRVMSAVPLLLFALTGCHVVPATPVAVLAGIEASSVAVFGRGVIDLTVSGASGRDCSIVRLDRGQSYCRPTDPLPTPPEFCTRSLGRVDCWINPEALPGPVHGVADGPSRLTPAQEAYRLRRWPDLW